MFGLGWGELVVVGLVALIVVGPKDLPVMFRTLGKFMGRARGMAREFTSAMNDAADSSGMGAVARDLRKLSNPKSMGLDALSDAMGGLDDWDADDSQTPKSDSAPEGSETAKLSAERKAQAKKIHDAAAKSSAERRAREAKEQLAKAEADLAKLETPPADTKAAE